MSDLIITARTLKSLVDPVLPLAGSDWELPVLTAVQVRVDGEWLTATATDRFVMGYKRIKGDWPKGWEALIPVTVLRTILRTYKPQRGDDPELTLGIADGSLTVSSSGGFADFLGAQTTYRLQDGEFPGVLKVVQDLLDVEPAPGVPAFNPAFLGRFAAAGADTVALHYYAPSPAKPMLVTDGETFWGAIMTRRNVGESATNATTLRHLLAPITAKPKPALTRKKAS